MSEQENAILQSLIELDDAVKATPTAQPKPNLLPLFARLDELTHELPKDTAPELLHYLGKKSYEKAPLARRPSWPDRQKWLPARLNSE